MDKQVNEVQLIEGIAEDITCKFGVSGSDTVTSAYMDRF
jgi:hypothetical protein